MNTVNAILQEKGFAIFSIPPGHSVYQAIEQLAAKEVGALLVTNEQDGLLGIISERDYARKVILKNKSSKETQVAEIMTTELITVTSATDIDRCKALMSHHKIRHLPVVDNDKLTGIISINDVLSFVIKDQTATIVELESYIMDDAGGEG